MHIYSTSGSLLLSLQYGISAVGLREELMFDSDISLRTKHGILCITKDVSRGTIQEPFIDDHWVYQDNRKVLWLPLDYWGYSNPCYSQGRYAFCHRNRNPAVLRIEFGKKP